MLIGTDAKFMCVNDDSFFNSNLLMYYLFDAPYCSCMYNITMFILLYERNAKLACATVSKVHVQINK